MQHFKVSLKDAPLRLDSFLRQTLGLSKREVLLILEHDLVTLNGKPLNQKHKGLTVEPNSTLSIEEFEHLFSGVIVPEANKGLSLLKEGDGFIVIDKPAHMPVMPLKAGETGTVLNAVVALHPELQGVGEGGLRSGVVHRLDTGTSGTLMLATTETQWQALRHAFKTHQTTKRYRALVQGQLKGKGFERMPLYVAQHKPAKVRVADNDQNKNVRMCSLSWEALEQFSNASLLDIRLETGFLHQIRVMFAHKGHPVLGDKLYGQPVTKLPRQMLHASYLNVCGIEAHSPDPIDFQATLEHLRSASHV